MKKIINGRLYDTDTAKEVGYYSNGYGVTDFHYCSETLYRKKTGEFFLYGDGGAMSPYCKSCGDLWSGSSEIIPYTEEMAKEWAMEYMSADDYMELFGAVEE